MCLCLSLACASSDIMRFVLIFSVFFRIQLCSRFIQISARAAPARAAAPARPGAAARVGAGSWQAPGPAGGRTTRTHTHTGDTRQKPERERDREWQSARRVTACECALCRPCAARCGVCARARLLSQYMRGRERERERERERGLWTPRFRSLQGHNDSSSSYLLPVLPSRKCRTREG